MPSSRSVDPAEVSRFNDLAKQWWDPAGSFAPLHKLNPARLTFIRDQIANHFRRETPNADILAGLTLLDIGCGGGLVSEPLAKLGAAVTGIDPGAANVEAARTHAQERGVTVDYRTTTAEELVASHTTFDVVLCLEVVEHVPNVDEFINMIARLVAPGGILILSTINRTLKSYALAIVGAEYVLRWLEPGTHQWDRFVKPHELRQAITTAQLVPATIKGLIYNPLADNWTLSRDTDVNYFLVAKSANERIP